MEFGDIISGGPWLVVAWVVWHLLTKSMPAQAKSMTTSLDKVNERIDNLADKIDELTKGIDRND